MANNKTYAVRDIDHDKSMLTLSDQTLRYPSYQEFNGSFEYVCIPFGDTIIDPLLFEFTDLDLRVNLFPCSEYFSGSLTTMDRCLNNTTLPYTYISMTENASLPQEVGTCSDPYQYRMNKKAAKQMMAGNISLSDALYTGFTVRWMAGIHEWRRACQDSRGVCVYNSTQTSFCPDGLITSDRCNHGRGTPALV